MLQSMGSKKVRFDLVTEQPQPIAPICKYCLAIHIIISCLLLFIVRLSVLLLTHFIFSKHSEFLVGDMVGKSRNNMVYF